MAFCNTKVLLISLVTSAVLLIAALLLAFQFLPDIIEHELKENVQLENGTEQFDRFVDLPFPLDFKIYVFNVENPDGILSGEKPNLTEIGPFVYKQWRHKNIDYTDCDEDTITYRETQTYDFDEEASAPLTADHMVTILNVPLLAQLMISESLFLAGIVDHCIRKTYPPEYQDMFIQVRVKDLLFDGLEFCKVTPEDHPCNLFNTAVCMLSSTKKNMDVTPDYSLLFSFFHYRERSDDGLYAVMRGVEDVSTLGHIKRWNDMYYTDYWGANTTCSQVKGADSTIYPPDVDRDQTFFIYATDVCRFVEIFYIKDTSFKDIDGYMFGTVPETFLPSTDTPQEDCFCTMLTKDETGQPSCFLDGVVDMQSCVGAPVVASFPHFLWADEHYRTAVEGMHPDEDIHRTFVILEPNTGTPLKGAKRLQLNIILRPVLGVRQLVDVTRVTLPVVWVEEGVEIPDKYRDKLQNMYFNMVSLADGLKWGFIAISTVAVVIFSGILMFRKLC